MSEKVSDTNIHIDEFNSLAEAIVGLANRWNTVHLNRKDEKHGTPYQIEAINACLREMGSYVKCTFDFDSVNEQNAVPDTSLLIQANEIINGERLKDYGSPRKSVERIAALWSAYLGVDVTWQQVCGMMVALKLSRTKETPDHFDSWLDIAGYAGVWDKANKDERPEFIGSKTATPTSE